jgi:hypothetical protein
VIEKRYPGAVLATLTRSQPDQSIPVLSDGRERLAERVAAAVKADDIR